MGWVRLFDKKGNRIAIKKEAKGKNPKKECYFGGLHDIFIDPVDFLINDLNQWQNVRDLPTLFNVTLEVGIVLS